MALIAAVTQFSYKVYPGYVNATRLEDGRVRLIVRSEEATSEAVLHLNHDEWMDFVRQITDAKGVAASFQFKAPAPHSDMTVFRHLTAEDKASNQRKD